MPQPTAMVLTLVTWPRISKYIPQLQQEWRNPKSQGSHTRATGGLGPAGTYEQPSQFFAGRLIQIKAEPGGTL